MGGDPEPSEPEPSEPEESKPIVDEKTQPKTDDIDGDDGDEWNQFSTLMRGGDRAYKVALEHLRGAFISRFSHAYDQLSDEPAPVTSDTHSHFQDYLTAKLPEAKRKEFLAKQRERDQSDSAKVRSRVGGKFTKEEDDWYDQYQAAKGSALQGSIADTTKMAIGGSGYKYSTLGDKAKTDLADVMQKVLPNFEQINSEVGIIPKVNWSKGTQHATKQRALKFLEAQKKVGIHFGAGSGKSAIMLGCFSHLHAQGKIKKTIVAVPSSIVGQFVGEAATFLKAGTYKYNANLGMSREERIASYKDPDLSIHVTTRESLSNDLLHLVEKHQGVDPETYRTKTEDEQRSLMWDACKAEGINPEELLLSVDESQDITARQGVDPSKRSLSLNALGHHSSYYVQSTGDMIKNSLSECYSFLHSMAPDKFNDMNKFMAEYAGNTAASKRALQRAIAPYSFAASTKPQDGDGRTLKMNEYQPVVKANEKIAAARQEILDKMKVISEWQTGHREKLKEQHGANYQPTTEDFNVAWDNPEVRAAIDHLGSNETWHKLDDKGKQDAIGGQVRAMGGLKKQALFRLYHLTPYEDNPKMQWTVDHAIKKFKEEGKPGIVFSGSSVAAEMMVKEFEKKGMRVAYIHGGLDGKGKDIQRLKFQSDKPEADILICTNAARTGVNLTRGKVLYHYDVPDTQEKYAQRSARIYRLKQSVDTEIYTPMLDAPEEKMSWARMERKGEMAKPIKARAERIDDTGVSRKIREARAAKAA